MIHFQIDDQAEGIWNKKATAIALATIAMVLRRRSNQIGEITQGVRLVKELPILEVVGIVSGHTDAKNRVITLNTGVVVGLPWGRAVSGDDLYWRLIRIAAHEAEHSAQMLRGHQLPEDDIALNDYASDPWYEIEARETSLDVLKGYYPGRQGDFAMGPSKRLYNMPVKSTYQSDWDSFKAGKSPWTETPVKLGSLVFKVPPKNILSR